jgi:hypothetical protein
MRKIIVLFGVLVLAALMTTGAIADGNSNVAYTWTLADLGQGIWGGGPLFADGSTGGNLPFSAENGQLIFHLHPTSWSYVVPGESVDICFTLHEIKGSLGFPPSFCLTEVFSPAGIPVTGTGMPLIIPNPDVPDLNLLIRVTPAN